MLSPWFWLSFGLVFVAVRWLADGWWMVASREVRFRTDAVRTDEAPERTAARLDRAA